MKLELLVLDKNFQEVDIIDTFISCIWTDRYNKVGDFEIFSSVDEELLSLCKNGYYLWTEGSEHLMIVEQRNIQTDYEDGPSLTITGRSLESILHRRIIWGQKILSGNFQDGVEALLNENIINPIDVDRKIQNFIFVRAVDPLITSLTIDAQYYGEDLYDVIETMCISKDIGFKILLNDNNQFEFSLYTGKDLTYDQTVNPYVIFSPEFDNLLNSNYVDSNLNIKNVAMVAGEGDGSTRVIKSVFSAGTGVAGLDRLELYVDASGISKTTTTGTLTDTQYQAELEQKGTESLAEYATTVTFEGEVEGTKTFIYGKDFKIGDIIQIENEYGHTGKARVSEFIISQDNTGINMYPSFVMIEE